MIYVRNILFAFGGLFALFAVGVVFQMVMPKLLSNATVVTVPSLDPVEDDRSLAIFTNLRRDGIPAILDPQFVEADVAETWMRPEERIIALSINGEHRAYPIKILSQHEIVNDVVGGEPVAVTW